MHAVAVPPLPAGWLDVPAHDIKSADHVRLAVAQLHAVRGGGCTSVTPSTGISNALANGSVYDEAPARKVSGGSTLIKALAVFLAAFF